MDIKDSFNFLIDDFNFNYEMQEFQLKNAVVFAHSFYNSSGCFTIHHMPVKGELDFYYSQKFHNNQKQLYEKIINVYDYEKDIWDKVRKKSFFCKPFFTLDNEEILNAVKQIIKLQILKNNEFFEIKTNQQGLQL